MRKTTEFILLAAALGGLVYRRPLSRMTSSAVARGLALAAYRHSLRRDHISQQELLKRRSASDEWHTTEGRKLFGRLLERVKAEYDLYNSGEGKQPPVVDILILSRNGSPSYQFIKFGR